MEKLYIFPEMIYECNVLFNQKYMKFMKIQFKFKFKAMEVQIKY